MNLPSQIFFNNSNLGNRAATLKENTLWLLPFYMAVATYCYYKKVRRTMRTAIVSHLLNGYIQGLFLLSPYVVRDYALSRVILSVLKLHPCSFTGCFQWY